MKKLIPFMVLVLLLSACSALGYVSEDELTAAEETISSLETDIDNLESEAAALRNQVNRLEGENETLRGAQDQIQDLEEELELWRGLLCPQTWDQAMSAYGSFPFEETGSDLYRMVFLTRWSFVPDSDSDAPLTALLQDIFDSEKSMLIDALNNCLIINPEFSPLGE